MIDNKIMKIIFIFGITKMNWLIQVVLLGQHDVDEKTRLCAAWVIKKIHKNESTEEI